MDIIHLIKMHFYTNHCFSEKEGIIITKKIELLSILFLVLLTFTGCISADEKNSRKVAEDFVRTLYTVDAGKITQYQNFMTAFGELATYAKKANIQPIKEPERLFNKKIKTIMTESGYKAILANRLDIVCIDGCVTNNYTMQVTDFNISYKTQYDIKENKAGYNYTANLKFVSTGSKEERTDVINGYVVLSKENGQWKVCSGSKTIPKSLLYK